MKDEVIISEPIVQSKAVHDNNELDGICGAIWTTIVFFFRELIHLTAHWCPNQSFALIITITAYVCLYSSWTFVIWNPDSRPFILHRLQKTQFERMCDPHSHTKLSSQEVQAIFYIFKIGLNVWQLLNCIWA